MFDAKKQQYNMKFLMISNTLWFIYNFNIELIRSLKKIGTVTILGPNDEYSDLLKSEVDEIIYIEFNSKSVNPLGGLILTHKFYNIFKKEKPDLILSYTIKPNIFGNFAAAKLNIPVINTITGLGTIFIRKTLITNFSKLLYRYAFKYTNHVFCLNNTDYSFFLNEKLISSENCSIVPGSGVNTRYFKTQRTKNEGRKFLFVGRLLGDKGIREFIEAAKQVIKDNPSIEFRIAGEFGSNNKTAISQSELESWEKYPQIIYIGKTDNIIEELKNADVMVLPSYREGLSKSLIEAASMCLPIITTNVPGCREIVKDNENGFLCIPKDAKNLAEKMQKMINLSETERLNMGQKGRILIEAEFDERIVIKEYISKINLVLLNK